MLVSGCVHEDLSVCICGLLYVRAVCVDVCVWMCVCGCVCVRVQCECVCSCVVMWVWVRGVSVSGGVYMYGCADKRLFMNVGVFVRVCLFLLVCRWVRGGGRRGGCLGRCGCGCVGVGVWIFVGVGVCGSCARSGSSDVRFVLLIS